jgi:hypothetical protein
MHLGLQETSFNILMHLGLEANVFYFDLNHLFLRSSGPTSTS